MNQFAVGRVETEETRVNQNVAMPQSAPASRVSTSFAEIFSPSCIHVLPPKMGKSSVLSQLVSLLVRAQRLPKRRAESVVQGLIEHERFGTTAIGRGLAFPHLRTTAVQHPIGAGAIAPNGINFNSLDGKPTRLVLMLLSPAEDRKGQIKLMGRLVAVVQTRMMQFLLEQELTPAQLYKFLCEQDASMAP